MIGSFQDAGIGTAGEVLHELDKPTANITTALYDLWLKKKGWRDMPRRDEFSPVEMKPLLPNIYMIDVLGGGADYKMRLFGTALTALIGEDFTGAKLSDIDARLGWRGKVYRMAYWRSAPVVYQFNLGDVGKPHVTTENVLLPVKDNNHNFSILLCASEIVRREGPSLD